jgi:hypothetical protein
MRGLRHLIPGITLLLLGAVAQAQTLTLEPFAFVAPSQQEGDPVKALPAAPTNLVAHAASNTQISLTWQFEDNGVDPIEFRVEARTSSGTFTDIGSAPPNARGVNVIGLTPGTTYFFRVRARNAEGYSPYSNVASATTLNGAGACIASSSAMCLNNGRFRVEATFLTPQGQTGPAQGVKLTDDSGYMWFFNASNIELVVKVLNGCGVNNRYWVFAGGLTNVRVVLRVTDTQTGELKRYVNPQGAAFQPIQDTLAFASCP